MIVCFLLFAFILSPSSSFEQQIISNSITNLSSTDATQRLLISELDSGNYWKSSRKSNLSKQDRLQKLINVIQSTPGPIKVEPDTWCLPHNQSQDAIFTTAMDLTYFEKDAIRFVGTARKVGFTGDIVIGILPGTSISMQTKLKEYNTIIYKVPIECAGKPNYVLCTINGYNPDFKLPLSIIRHYLYQIWALKYTDNTQIMISDFRDVFFQTNPFKYRRQEWGVPLFQFVAFQEMHPNRVINRCPINAGLILNCYGNEALKMIGSYTISCSGVSIGTSSSIAAYSYLITQQVDPRVRYGRNSTVASSPSSLQIADRNCISHGVDQGFHNWLLYSGMLNRYMDVKVYQQGEGPVNTLGGFYGEKKLLRASLAEWKILRGEAPFKYVYNWNGELTAVVHQMDRFLTSELSTGYGSNLAAFQHVK